MLMDLIGAFVIGIAAAGAVWLLRRHVKSIPGYAAPICAGLAMLGFTIWSEYSWYSRTTAELPGDVVVTSSHKDGFWYRPWTLLNPYVNRFAAVDTLSIRRNAERPGEILVDVLLIARHRPGSKIPILIDCPGARRATVVDGMTIGDDGAVENLNWHELADTNLLYVSVCSNSDAG